MELSQPMRKSRKPRVIHGSGEAWFYVSPNGIEICVAGQKGMPSDSVILLSTRQLKRALEIIEEPQ